MGLRWAGHRQPLLVAGRRGHCSRSVRVTWSTAFGLVCCSQVFTVPQPLHVQGFCAQGEAGKSQESHGEGVAFPRFLLKTRRVNIDPRQGASVVWLTGVPVCSQAPSLRTNLCRKLSTRWKNGVLTPLGLAMLSHCIVCLLMVVWRLLSKNGMYGLPANLRSLCCFSEHSAAVGTCLYCSQTPLQSSVGRVIAV